ncbi:Probable molybdenum ABC transporter, periplasmic [Mycobacteroides abscessus subsp. abscessus]|uniref:molybdate ABC transporter substrate-binding protein n=1 Tax=Mycobacteroides abscessus TaxID=36809 RepID=UPI00092BFC5E|nr:extracellular solute-binding protein [Mycobacteroides abscessus]SIK76481.1 Probable molybdenum ABC transporter, periplasmic [Mycobacteroides abscessus subsp. abscessus]
MFGGAPQTAGLFGPRRSASLVAALAAFLAVAGCGTSQPPAPTTRPGDAGEIGGAAVPMTLRVSVDQAMRTVFSELAKRFQIDHPGTQIQLKFKRSQELADELEREPAPDVLVVRDVDMHRAAQAGQVKDPAAFAANRLVIVTPPGNPNHVFTFNDAVRSGARLAVCAPELACGAATARVAESLAAPLGPAQTERTANAVVDAVAEGRAEVGLTYSSYATSDEPRVTTLSFAGDAVSVERYSIAVTTKSENQNRAQQLADSVRSGDGHRLMSAFGFGAP